MKDGGDGPAAMALRGKYKSITGRFVLLKDKKMKKRRGGGPGPSTVTAEEEGVLFLQVTIKYHLATDVAKNWRVENAEVESGLRQLFSLSTENGKDDDDDDEMIPSVLLSEWGARNIHGKTGIHSGELVTSNNVYELRLQPNDAFFQQSHAKWKPTPTLRETNTRPLPPPNQRTNDDDDPSNQYLSHDRSKNAPIAPSSLFFQRLGVTDVHGKPVNGMSSKLRQCQKFVEIVGNLVDNSISLSPPMTTPLTTTMAEHHSRIRVIDMGCGRGYLTFALHSYLCDKYNSGIGNAGGSVTVETRGIDRRPKLVKEINDIATELGGVFSSLRFDTESIRKMARAHNCSLTGMALGDGEEDDIRRRSVFEGTLGNVRDVKENRKCESNDFTTTTTTTTTLDVVIALHACDTATDDALHFAIQSNANVIVVAPCCQYELRPQIDRHVTTTARNNKNNDGTNGDDIDHPLSEVLRHAVYRERATETVTDSIRAILLEIAGYETKVFEFVSSMHTTKNVMITATKRVEGGQRWQDSSEYLRRRREKLVTLARLYGVHQHHLAMLMGESISG